MNSLIGDFSVSLIPPWFLWPRTMTLLGPWWPVLILVTRCCFWPADKWGLKGNPYAGNGGRLVKEPAVSVTAIPLYFGLDETLYIGYWTPLSPLSIMQISFKNSIWCISGDSPEGKLDAGNGLFHTGNSDYDYIWYPNYVQCTYLLAARAFSSFIASCYNRESILWRIKNLVSVPAPSLFIVHSPPTLHSSVLGLPWLLHM